jgi:hypothetical protein
MKSIAYLVCFVALLGNVAMADDKMGSAAETKGPMKPSAEQRQKMAGLHESMAACLRSDRPMPECRQEMMKGCKDTMGKDGCSMIGGKGGRGMHQHMMDDSGAAKE